MDEKYSRLAVLNGYMSQIGNFPTLSCRACPSDFARDGFTRIAEELFADKQKVQDRREREEQNRKKG